ncbi:MAG: DUF2779 domain-containing protein [Minisyncoccota bacterium]
MYNIESWEAYLENPSPWDNKIEFWKECVRNPFHWISQGETNQEIANLIYNSHRSTVINSNCGKYGGHIMMHYGLAIECYLKGISLQKGMDPLNAANTELEGNFKSHNLVYFYKFVFGDIDIVTKNYLEKLKRGIESGKYPFEKVPIESNYKKDIEDIVLFCQYLIRVCKIKAKTKDNYMTIISKSDYILYRECKKNIWLKKHRPDIYDRSGLSEFEKSIIETGNEVEALARKLFTIGILIEGRGIEAQELTQKYILKKESILFQPIFVRDRFLAAVDILEYDAEKGGYNIYEVKATNEIKERIHFYDLAFQVNLLRKCDVKVVGIKLLHLNPDYVRHGELDLKNMFMIEDVTEGVEKLVDEVSAEMDAALEYLSRETEPAGHCCCINKSRNNHCTTFHYSNPDVPEYSIHDIARIGSSKKKLQQLIEANIFKFEEIPEEMEFSEIQKNQIDAHIQDRIIMIKELIAKELEGLVFPLYFLDYETCPAAVPRFDGYSPYQQIPFQYSLHKLASPSAKLEHFEFLHMKSDDPSRALAEKLQKDIGDKGTIIVWNKKFECKRNEEIGERLPEFKIFMDSVNNRIYDLMDVFSKQYYVHKHFKGSTSIKYVLPVLAPELTYKNLNIQEGGTASQSWDKIALSDISKEEKDKIAKDLLAYCERDTYAMYAIWRELDKIVS